jgi:hypothetical protein
MRSLAFLVLLLPSVLSLEKFYVTHELLVEDDHRSILTQNNQQLLDMTNQAIKTVKEIISEKCAWHENLQYRVGFFSNSNTLASVGSYFVIQDGVAKPSVFYNTEKTDMYINVNRDKYWSLQDESTCGVGYDLVSVLLHEVLHGMGILSSFKSETKHGFCQNGECYFSKYETLIHNKHGLFIDNLDKRWLGETMHIGGVEVYNPSIFIPGSSLSHIEDKTSVIYPSLSSGICKQTIDDKVAYLLNEIGWECQSSYVPINDTFFSYTRESDDNMSTKTLVTIIVAVSVSFAVITVIFVSCVKYFKPIEDSSIV